MGRKKNTGPEIPAIKDDQFQPLPRKAFVLDAHCRNVVGECVVYSIQASSNTAWAAILDADGTIRGVSCKQIRFEKPSLPVLEKPEPAPAPEPAKPTEADAEAMLDDGPAETVDDPYAAVGD
jgi:hypothetical protein